MCLTPIHLKPLIAEKDIFCKKRLIKYLNHLYTPFRGVSIEFNNGIYIQKAYRFSVDEFGNINQGIHSHSKYYRSLDSTIVYPCIIPKGTQYYIGSANDLVSLKLIIFKNKFRYWIYKIFHK